jgi:N-acetylmuramic acid 6-phosphate etherase
MSKYKRFPNWYLFWYAERQIYASAGGFERGDRALIGASASLRTDVLAGYRRAVAAVDSLAPEIAAAAERAAALYEAGGRLIYVGAGASGLIAAQDAAELPGTFGLDSARIVKVIAGGAERPFDIEAAAEDDTEAGAADIHTLAPLAGSAVIAVSASGATPYTLAAARQAREAGAYVIALACRPVSPLLAIGETALCLDTGEEALKGSTRLAAGTAQKCALGLFSTLLGEALGHVHAGRMVNLRADNDKLKRRALDIVIDISCVDEARARRALELARGEVKYAILIASGAASASEAESRLGESSGRLAPALRRLGAP